MPISSLSNTENTSALDRNSSQEMTLANGLVVFASAVGVFISVIYFYTLGVFIAPIEESQGWSRAEVTSGLAIVSVISVTLAPFVGMGIDRWGARRIALLGLTLFGAAFAALSSVSTSIWHWWFLWVLVAFGDILIKPTVWLVAVSSRFNKRRGIAMGIALSGTGVAAAVLPSISYALIVDWGWRVALFLLGLSSIVIALPIVYRFFYDGSGAKVVSNESSIKTTGMTKKEGLLSSVFIRMAIATLFVASGILGLMVHLVPILTAKGISAQSAASFAGAAGIASIIGRILTGVMLDRYRGALVGALIYGIPGMACFVLLLLDGSAFSGILSAVIIGFSIGAELDVVAYLSSKFFGQRNYGFFLGTLVGMISFGAGVGSTILGGMYDHYQSYEVVLWLLLPCFFISSCLIGSLGDYPEFEKPKA